MRFAFLMIALLLASTMFAQKVPVAVYRPRFDTVVVNGVPVVFAFVEKGSFKMGCTLAYHPESGVDEDGIHTVILNSYYIGITEVTIDQYMAFCRETHDYYPEWYEWWSFYFIYGGTDSEYEDAGMSERHPDYPVTGVSWFDAVYYCEWLSKKTGHTYRLPTEAEWEYAARGGDQTSHTQYAGSDNIDEVAWYDANANSTTHPVAHKKANPLGLYDMSGNVWEWCIDWYDSKYYYRSNPINPRGAEDADHKLLRGGSWCDDKDKSRSAYRGIDRPEERGPNCGFRVVRTD